MPIQLNRDPPLAWVTLNRPRTLNAMDVPMLDALGETLDQLICDPGVRAIILSGAGPAFSAGADLAATLADLPRDAGGEIDLAYMLHRHYNPLVRKIRKSPKPIIAAVNGVAAGGASSLALMADLTLAARSAKFAQAFVKVGLMPDVGGSWILPRVLGPQQALGATLLGHTLTAEQALARGLIWDVVDDDQLQQAAKDLALRLADIPETAFDAIKRSLQAGLENGADAQLQLEAELQGQCGRADFQALATSFLQRGR